VDEHRFGRVAPARLEHGEGAPGVDVEVVEGAGGGEVVARLGGGVDDQLGAQAGDQLVDRLPVADVEGVVGVARRRRLEALPVPGDVAPGPKKSARMLLSTPSTLAPMASKNCTASEPMSRRCR
jgi:hypothetical protein